VEASLRAQAIENRLPVYEKRGADELAKLKVNEKKEKEYEQYLLTSTESLKKKRAEMITVLRQQEHAIDAFSKRKKLNVQQQQHQENLVKIREHLRKGLIDVEKEIAVNEDNYKILPLPAVSIV